MSVLPTEAENCGRRTIAFPNSVVIIKRILTYYADVEFKLCAFKQQDHFEFLLASEG